MYESQFVCQFANFDNSGFRVLHSLDWLKSWKIVDLAILNCAKTLQILEDKY